MFQNLFDHFKKKVHRKTKEIRELKNDLQSKDENISKLGTEIEESNTVNEILNTENEELNTVNEELTTVNEILSTENAELIEESKMKDKKIEELKKQLQLTTKVDIPTKQNLPKTSVKKSDKPTSLFQSPVVEFVEWTEFKFKTGKRGADGPSKNECIQYYIKE